MKMKIRTIVLLALSSLRVACTTTSTMIHEAPSETPVGNATTTQSRPTSTPLLLTPLTKTSSPTQTINLTIADQEALYPCLLADFPATQTYANYLTPRNLFAWSPDGHTLAYVSTIEQNVDLSIELRFTSANPINTLEILASDEVNNLSWSPDGSQLALSVLRKEDQLFTILTADADSGNVQDLMPGDAARTDTGLGTKFIHSWWDKNYLLVLAHCGTGCTKPLLLNSRDGKQKALFELEREGEYLGTAYTWSPDKKWMVVSSGARPQLGISPGGGGSISWLSGPGAMNPELERYFSFNPTWAPDNSHFAFLRQKDDVSKLPELWVWDVRSNQSTFLLDGAIRAAWSPETEDYLAIITLGQPKLDAEGFWSGAIALRDGPNLLGLGIYSLSSTKMIAFRELGEIDLGYLQPGEFSSRLLPPVWSPDGAWLAYRDAQDNPKVFSLSGMILYEVDTHGQPVTGITWSSDNKMLAMATVNQLWVYTIQCSP
jgi:WD40 repeat protein